MKPTMGPLAQLLTTIGSAAEIDLDRFVSDEEIIALEQRNPPILVERLSGGTLLATPPGELLAGARGAELVGQIALWADNHREGIALGARSGLAFPDGALLSPDAAFLRKDRWDVLTEAERDGFLKIPPDAVFEMLTSCDRMKFTRKKIGTYLRYGVRLVVLLDPYTRHVYIGGSGDMDVRDVGTVASLDCGPAMPSFVLDVAAVFAAGR
jgi:Uma2 family endonuclease